jgi:HTH-type transcriptional regulator/antitoxin HigA
MAVMESEHSFRPGYALPPGETIADLLVEHGMTQTELAKRLGVTLKHVNQVVNGGASISAGLALGLEKVFRVPASFWLNRESLYQADLARQSETKELASHIAWAKAFPVKELKKRGHLPPEAAGVGLVQALLTFLGVASPTLWQDPAVAYRKSRRYKSDPFALAAWLRVGELEAADIDCEPHDADRFIAALQEARHMTRLRPGEWQQRLKESLADAGVAFVIADTFQGARANGATRWLAPDKALIQLSLRYHWEDIFWFSFFHEAAHVALHRKKGIFVDGLALADSGDDDEAKRLEDEADRFAARVLIPQTYEPRLRQLQVADIPAFAEELGIAPAIVVGRLQHEGLIHYRESVRYKRRLHFVDDPKQR